MKNTFDQLQRTDVPFDQVWELEGAFLDCVAQAARPGLKVALNAAYKAHNAINCAPHPEAAEAPLAAILDALGDIDPVKWVNLTTVLGNRWFKLRLTEADYERYGIQLDASVAVQQEQRTKAIARLTSDMNEAMEAYGRLTGELDDINFLDFMLDTQGLYELLIERADIEDIVNHGSLEAAANRTVV